VILEITKGQLKDGVAVLTLRGSIHTAARIAAAWSRKVGRSGSGGIRPARHI